MKRPDLTYRIDVEPDGTFDMPFLERMRREVGRHYAGKTCRLFVRAERQPKTWEQIKAFHGPIVSQYIDYVQEMEGRTINEERAKRELKAQFLEIQPVFNDDGTAHMIFVPDPYNPGGWVEVHEHRLPSLADLSVEEMNQLITDILDDFQHVRGWPIVIERPEAVEE